MAERKNNFTVQNVLDIIDGNESDFGDADDYDSDEDEEFLPDQQVTYLVLHSF